MATMDVKYCIVFLVQYLIVCNGVLTNPDNAEMQQHILRLEEIVSDFQTQLQTQEQKQAAVLSGILSKLASTTDELANVNCKLDTLEVQHNLTLTDLAAVKEQLQDLSSVKTEYDTLRKDYNLLFVNLETTQKDCNATTEKLIITNTKLADLQNKTKANSLELILLNTEINSTKHDLEFNTVAFNILGKNVTATTSVVLQQTSQLTLTAEEVKELHNKVSISSKTVAFSSTLEIDVHLKDKQIVKYERVLTNIGEGYNNVTGTFICPHSGTYVFSIHGFMRKGKRMSLQLVHNYTTLVSVFGYDEDYHGTSNSAVINLIIGDEVWVQSQGNSSLYGDHEYHRNTFLGYLL